MRRVGCARWLFQCLLLMVLAFLPTQRTQLACFTCPRGKVAPPGSASLSACLGCSDGYFLPRSASNINQCAPCGRGTYAVAGTLDACDSCPVGLTTPAKLPQTGLRNETICTSYCPLAGQYTRVNGTCAQCLRGFFCGAGNASMVQCPSGQTTKGLGSTKLSDCTVACPPGYGVNLVDGACVPCPLGTYSPDETIGCIACPQGFTTFVAGATTVATCLQCPPGKYLSSTVGGTAGCLPCSKGRYSTVDQTTVDKCAGVCPVGRSSKLTGNKDDTGCEVYCNPGEYVDLSTGLCTLCPPGTFENNNMCTPCKACAATADVGSTDPEQCMVGSQPKCAPGSSPDRLTYKCGQCPSGTYSPGGSGNLLCGGVPTPSPTMPTFTYITVKHSYSFYLGLTKFNGATFPTSFAKAVTTVFALPDGSVKKLVRSAVTTSRRQLLLQYNAQLSYIITAPNTDPKAIIATLAVPGTSALLGSTAASLTGIQATVGTITFLDLSPTPGPTMLPTPFSIFAQAGSVAASGISVTLIIALILGVGIGGPVLACCVYQAALLVRLCIRPKAEPLKEVPVGEPYKQELSEDEFRRAMEQNPNVQECMSDANTVAAPEPSALSWAATLLPATPVLPFFGFGQAGGGASGAGAGEVDGGGAVKRSASYDLTMGLGTSGDGEGGDHDDDDDKKVEVGDDDDEVRSATSVPPADSGFNSNWFTNPFWSRRQEDSF